MNYTVLFSSFLVVLSVVRVAGKPSNHLDISVQPAELSDIDGAEDPWWSEESMLNAQPLPLPQLTEQQLQDFISHNLPPGEQFDIKDFITGADEDQSDKAETIHVSENWHYIHQVNPDGKPYWNAGRLYFQDPNGKESTCSAQYISSDIILTAAHCLYNTETESWFKRHQFCPRNDRSACRTMHGCIVYTEWTAKNNYGYDYAVCKARAVSDKSWMRIGEYDEHNSGPYQAIGYPYYVADGKFMYGTLDRISQIRPFKDFKLIIRMSYNTLNRGSSGGAWLANPNTNEESDKYNQVISVNSFLTINDDYTMYGPRIKKRDLEHLMTALD